MGSCGLYVRVGGQETGQGKTGSTEPGQHRTRPTEPQPLGHLLNQTSCTPPQRRHLYFIFQIGVIGAPNGKRELTVVSSVSQNVKSGGEKAHL